jgi:exodeoxyribonuclease X
MDASSSLAAETVLSPRIRVIDLETAGPGPHDVCEIGWQDVVSDSAGVWALVENCGAAFVDPGRSISPDMMAIHHIQDDWVRGAGYWKDTAPPILRPAGGVVALAAHRAAFEQRYCTPALTGGARWICTWKCAQRLWPDLPRFSNQMLRYLRRPEGLAHERGLPAHRALPDAYVTAHHLRDMLNQTSIENLLIWSREPALLPRVPAGPDRGRRWDRLDAATLRGFQSSAEADVRFTATRELQRRGASTAAPSEAPGQPRLL